MFELRQSANIIIHIKLSNFMHNLIVIRMKRKTEMESTKKRYFI